MAKAAHKVLLGGPWDFVTTYNWDYNPTYGWGNLYKSINLSRGVLSRFTGLILILFEGLGLTWFRA